MSSPLTLQHAHQFQSFTCFLRLPLELRRVIWHLAMPERILIFNIDPRSGRSWMFEKFLIHQPRRPLSEVNLEARGETNGQYMHLKRVDYPDILANDLFFNSQLDIMYLPMEVLNYVSFWALLFRFLGRLENPIKKLAFDAISEEATRLRNNPFLDNMRLLGSSKTFFDSLEELYLVAKISGNARSEQISTPVTQIMIAGEEWPLKPDTEELNTRETSRDYLEDYMDI